MVIGITLLKGDLAWRLKGMVKCLATAGVFQPVLVDTAEATRCKVAMVDLQALVDILPTVKPATTAATRVDALTYFHTTIQLGGPFDVLFSSRSPPELSIQQLFSRLRECWNVLHQVLNTSGLALMACMYIHDCFNSS